MSIGKEVKEIVTARRNLLNKIQDTFTEALEDIAKSDVAVRKLTQDGYLSAAIDICQIDISIEEVLEELKGQDERSLIEREVPDQAIENIVNKLIKRELSI